MSKDDSEKKKHTSLARFNTAFYDVSSMMGVHNHKAIPTHRDGGWGQDDVTYTAGGVCVIKYKVTLYSRILCTTISCT